MILLLNVFLQMYRRSAPPFIRLPAPSPPYGDGEKGTTATLAIPSPRPSRGEGKGEGQRRPWLEIRLSRGAPLPCELPEPAKSGLGAGLRLVFGADPA
ncbi:MAG: hypothetical protein EOS40_24280 [Mesorhizobium sp.]|nr:MAG: hypothetical protein EOQ40_22960 [Mesorhizobium sp.]RWD98366.1 MAG: hypothetical protein EOS40_24280 [Mesorhizobium sp.]TIS48205.1 MAG: hypothetical protein E5W96_17795 [Mesorhizobium sp.]TIT87306.1 MAG: hypothetical protein E5W55_28875 [Mesorhizobium sp.]